MTAAEANQALAAAEAAQYDLDNDSSQAEWKAAEALARKAALAFAALRNAEKANGGEVTELTLKGFFCANRLHVGAAKWAA